MSEFEKFIEDNFKELKSRIESGNFFAKTMRDSMHATWLKQQSEIDQLKKQLNGSEYLKEEHRKRRCELAKEIEKLKAEKAGLESQLNQANQLIKMQECGVSEIIETAEKGIRKSGGNYYLEKIIELLKPNKALRGGDQNTKNSIQAIESNGNRGGDQNERGEHE